MLIKLLEYIKNNPNSDREQCADGLKIEKEKIKDDFDSLIHDKLLRSKQVTKTNEFGGSKSYPVFSINAKGLEFLSNVSSTSTSKNKVDKLKKKIFVSHAYTDKGIAERIIEKLLIPIFGLDKKNDIFFTSKRETGINPSLNWRNKIKASIAETDVFIALITTNFKNKEMCQNELGAAWIENKEIFPLIIPPITFENFSVVVADLQAANIRINEDVKSFVESLEIILERLYPDTYELKNVEESIKAFSKSLRSYLRKNPDLFHKITKVKKKEISVTDNVNTKNTNGDIASIIKKQSKINWPDDYSMQVNYIDEQTKAYTELDRTIKKYARDKVITSIIERAINEWPNDFEMQLHTANEQIESYVKLK